MEKIIENEYIEFFNIDGILYSRYKEGLILDELNARSIIRLRHEISNNEKQYWLHDITNLKSMNKGGRDVADKEGQDFLYACAILVNSHVTKFIFNTFLKLKKPKMPFHVFNKEEEAIKWLSKIKTENEKINH